MPGPCQATHEEVRVEQGVFRGQVHGTRGQPLPVFVHREILEICSLWMKVEIR